MTTDYRKLDYDDLLIACGCLESGLIAFINRCERNGIDASELREILDDVHAAVDGLRE